MHKGDVRRVSAVLPSEALGKMLRGAETEMANAVIFSVLGERSLADMCSGGDFDGDEVGISMSRWLTVAGGGHRDHV